MLPEITIAITHFERFDMLTKCFPSVMGDERVKQILILDDCSEDGSYEKIINHFEFEYRGRSGVNMVQQLLRRGMQQNKADAVALSKKEWVVLFDSDNVIESKYLNALESISEFFPDTIYAPEKALPNFIYSEFAGKTIDRSNVKDFISIPYFGALINTSNYLVHRDTYCKNYLPNPEIKGTDTAWHFLQHLKNGGKFHIVKGLEYEHLVHSESTWMQDASYNMDWGMKIEKLLMEL